MQRGIEKSEKSKHTTIANQPELTCQFAHWSNRQRDKQEDQNPITGGMGDHFDRIGAQRLVVSFPTQPRQWGQAGQKDYRFKPSDHGELVVGFSSVVLTPQLFQFGQGQKTNDRIYFRADVEQRPFRSAKPSETRRALAPGLALEILLQIHPAIKARHLV